MTQNRVITKEKRKEKNEKKLKKIKKRKEKRKSSYKKTFLLSPIGEFARSNKFSFEVSLVLNHLS